MPEKKLRFSAADRSNIRKQSVGKPTGTIVTLAGVEFDLVPLTTEQAEGVFSILEAFSSIKAQANKDGVADVDQDTIATLIPREGRRIRTVLRSVLHDAAVASDSIDDESVFDEWFNGLPLLETVKTMLPKIVEAQGLMTMLGNSSTPSPELELAKT